MVLDNQTLENQSCDKAHIWIFFSWHDMGSEQTLSVKERSLPHLPVSLAMLSLRKCGSWDHIRASVPATFPPRRWLQWIEIIVPWLKRPEAPRSDTLL